ncbi:MAG TPA: (E)-4-hydroxy-3-methylbut-2-enyl-diphosphate synthase, partial [Chloroflexia bacterium]|nr:(E)-4-hydroxy-3-methylbut-2-enyl-diphosphate synthase [Chloroflexia bacterium]
MVGKVGVGGNNPLRIQSMTTTLTKDVDSTLAQTLRLIDVGCEIVRITTPTTADAKALGEVKRRLLARGIQTPLAADIHFSPGAAMEAALWADKVRINPGNFADAKLFKVLEYTDADYGDELARIEEKFAPVILRCKERGVAMRIGTNHGSLSDRIMNRYGDTPEGMVESALEFIRMCEKYDYFDIIVSMKASNPKVMIQAYRLLAARMAEAGMEYPFHLGVTEAGNAEDGRIKSAIGIGALLEDGLGDTIRVSLTEDPEFEVPVAYHLAERYTPRGGRVPLGEGGLWPVAAAPANALPDGRDPYRFEPRWTHAVQIGKSRLGANLPAAVVVSLAGRLPAMPTALTDVLSLARRAGTQGVRADVLSVGITGPDDVVTLGKVAAEIREVGRRFPLVAITGNPALVAPALEVADGLKLALVHGQDP